MDSLRQEVQEFQERWNSMVLDITEDLKITCDEAYTVRKWLTTERRAYKLLKRQINAEIRRVRDEYGGLIAKSEDDIAAKEMRVDMARVIFPNKGLLVLVDELLLKADEMEIRVERLIRQCQER